MRGTRGASSAHGPAGIQLCFAWKFLISCSLHFAGLGEGAGTELLILILPGSISPGPACSKDLEMGPRDSQFLGVGKGGWA